VLDGAVPCVTTCLVRTVQNVLPIPVWRILFILMRDMYCATLQALKAAQMESRLLQQERMAQQSESRAAHMENRIVELQRMLEGAQGQH